ncbi:RDD family protein [Dictyobacter vulcani]|uniref:RDD family protein n=1 Tax=Dictyobacter vulcani TaxID=2607529 RepID=UPI001386B652|nr:RDD family protein [Dictyobacter vulcani]
MTDHADAAASISANPAPDVSVVRQRVIAGILDFLCLNILALIVNTTFGVVRIISGTLPQAGQTGWYPYTATTSVDWWWLALLAFSYFFVLETLFSTTIGKTGLGLYVIPAANERKSWRITPWQAFLRNILRPIEALQLFYALGAGLLTLICIERTKQHQHLGDLLAHTLVVDKKSLPNPPYPASQPHLRTAILLVVLASLLAGCSAFYYYGRPPLVIESLYNTHQLLGSNIQSYQLGTPAWGTDKNNRSIVTYPIQFKEIYHGKMQTCDGKLTLHWENFPSGWTSDGGYSHCTP